MAPGLICGTKEYPGCYYNNLCGNIFGYYSDNLSVTFGFGRKLLFNLPYYLNV